MDEKLEEILNKTASYVESSQTEIKSLKSTIEKTAAEKQAFNLQAQRTAAVLADRGYMGPEQVNDFVDKIASNPLQVLKTLENMASLIEVPSLGGPSAVKVASADGPVDPFVQEFFPELVRSASSGLVD